MTLCIGAIARSEKRFVTVSDFMLSNQIMSAEPALSKVSFIGSDPCWTVLYAGDPTHSTSVSARVRDIVEHGPSLATPSVYRQEFKREVESKINDELLSPFGITRTDFIKEGRGQFGVELFGKMLDQINDTKLGTTFLMGTAMSLFSVEDPGVIQNHNALAFHAIGTGATLANASLMGIYDPDDSLREILYRLLEAKFRGEAASGVGRRTLVTISDENGKSVQGVSPEDCEKVRDVWLRKGQPQIPKEFFELELGISPFEPMP
jgi:hypothetical protein